MKTQMRFQKTLCLLTLIMSAITIVYAFGFITGGMATIGDIFDYRNDYFNAANVYNFGQQVNDIILILGIVFLCLVALMYIFACQKRRNYYITNYIAIGVSALYMVVFAVVGIILVVQTQVMFISEVDWETFYGGNISLNRFAHTGDSQVMFYIGYVVYFLVILNALALGYNLLWKIKLMKGEKALLEAGLQKEVA